MTDADDEQPTAAAGTDAPVPAPDDPAPDESALDEAAPDDRAAARSGRRSDVLVALVAVLFVVSVGLGVIAAAKSAALTDDRGERREAAQAAGAIAEALLTYDHTDMEATKERVLALASGSFREEYEEAFPALTQLMEETKATSSASIKDVFLGDIEAGSATAVVVADVTAVATSGSRRAEDRYIRVSLVKVEGRWRIDSVISLNLDLSGTRAPRDPGGAGTPTTTTPAP